KYPTNSEKLSFFKNVRNWYNEYILQYMPAEESWGEYNAWDSTANPTQCSFRLYGKDGKKSDDDILLIMDKNGKKIYSGPITDWKKGKQENTWLEKYSDLKNMTRDDLRNLRNEIYARHGYIFKSEDLSVYFRSKEWYIPNPDFSESKLSAEEIKLITEIRELEDKK
ncbi:MAG: YARHG domain-containing protein, partial [Elusimicrobiota bacterium]|nr:YARHG domain-containing protein [Elusimicrobiota bacterium]